MNQEIKQKWVEALRSGQYVQGFGRLRDGRDRFCVYGVLCNLHAEAHPEIAVEEHDPFSYLGQTHCVPPEVRQWADLRSFISFTHKGTRSGLANLNDTGGLSFKKLAKLIEEQL